MKSGGHNETVAKANELELTLKDWWKMTFSLRDKKKAGNLE